MRIAIIGASSQVGSSIALFLKYFKKAEVVCFIRGTYSSIFFDILGITYDSINLENGEQLRHKMEGFDAVIDCSYPAGQLYSIIPAIEKNLNSIISVMPKNSVFIYMSSIMAYGMPEEKEHVAQYAIPRTSYAYIKRKAEHQVIKLSEKYDIKGFNFRLGQVHGFLQSVNSSFREKLSGSSIAYVKGSRQDLTNTIFINSLCEAILRCVSGEIKSGMYTLVSQPQWSLDELYGYYQNNYNVDCKLEYFNGPKSPSQRNTLISKGIIFVKKYRPLLETYVLLRSPKISVELKGRYRQSEVLRSVQEEFPKQSIDLNLLGTPSLKMIDNIHSSVDEVTACEREMEQWYNKVVAENRK